MKSTNNNPSNAQTCCCDNEDSHSQDDGHNHGGETEDWLAHWPLLIALVILVVTQVLHFGFSIEFSVPISLIVFGIALLLAGYNVFNLAWLKAIRFDFFNEFFLMSVATIGAFAIGSFSEGVAVMVFYSIGEWFQDIAVGNAKKSIKALLDVRPDVVEVMRDGKLFTVSPTEINIGEIIHIKAGEKVALDGEMVSAKATFNTAALTGESKPDEKAKGDAVYAGMINLRTVAEIKVTSNFKDSKLSKILEMVQDATARKSQTQLFISRFAKVYTPIVFALAVLVVLLPMLFVSNYHFQEWFYRSLVFLVISCPCALVVSIPLGYFGGIGLASKHGILFKGGNFLDVMTKIDTVVMDKTGTLTKGVFDVQKVHAENIEEQMLLEYAAAIESKSNHPIAKAIETYVGKLKADLEIKEVHEIAGCGLKALINGKEVLAGNLKLLKKFEVGFDKALETIKETIVVMAIDKQYVGYITIADELKDDAELAIERLHKLGLKTVVLSGDKQGVVDEVARVLNIDEAYGGLLPEDKVAHLQTLKDQNRRIAFVGDGINDAPVIALADAGIAMGGLGSDAAIETADIVIQNDQPSKIWMAIKISKLTRNVVWQNIALAMGVKIIVLALGAGGIATLWEAVIADVGVALLAILNAVRIQNKEIG
ncbi:Cd2+/Zn2+-exporting ATPase [Pedobacter sp. UYP30]|uniref:heavy metal translocating P-type ATPase n=1 Tax=Pedobacter sp. UYP30 TaxID=1756400 RepID=UPI003393BF36